MPAYLSLQVESWFGWQRDIHICLSCSLFYIFRKSHTEMHLHCDSLILSTFYLLAWRLQSDWIKIKLIEYASICLVWKKWQQTIIISRQILPYVLWDHAVGRNVRAVTSLSYGVLYSIFPRLWMAVISLI